MRAIIKGNTEGLYIDPRHNETYINPRIAVNYDDVDMDGVNCIVVTRFFPACRGEEYRIVMTSGYTTERGLFNDYYG